MADRYFVESPIAGDRAQLVGSEAHHLLHVMRAKRGDSVTLFDGSGDQFTARIETLGRSDVELEVLQRETVDRELPIRLTLGVALPKGDRQRWLVEKATELGVTCLKPLVTERSNEHQSDASLSKLRRAVIEASKQCGRNRLMEVSEPTPLAAFLSSDAPVALRLIAQPGGTPLGQLLHEHRGAVVGEVAIAIGPEADSPIASTSLPSTTAGKASAWVNAFSASKRRRWRWLLPWSWHWTTKCNETGGTPPV
jgi:16S rRNA (uracil1498-N3)-methyltransferase